MSESLFQPDPTLAAMEAKLPDKPGPIIEPIGKRGPPRKLHPLRIGQLSMLLSFGFSHREAATWPEVSHGTISNLVADDVDFRQMVDRFSYPGWWASMPPSGRKRPRQRRSAQLARPASPRQGVGCRRLSYSWAVSPPRTIRRTRQRARRS